jgi:hypothetical protein
MEEKKALWISKDLHTEIKILSARHNVSCSKIAEQLLREAVRCHDAV